MSTFEEDDITHVPYTKKKQTILVWYKSTIVVRHVELTPSDAIIEAEDIIQSLAHTRNCPQWQILEGWVKIEFTKMSWTQM